MIETILLVIAALAPAIILCTYIYKKDRVEKEPFSLLIKLFLLGAVSCIPIAFLSMGTETAINCIFTPFSLDGETYPGMIGLLYHILIFFIAVALVEEGGKYFVVRICTKRSREFNSLFDGIIYAVFVSLGFAAFENVLYVLQNGWANAVLRAVMAVPGHMFDGILMGYYYSFAHIKENVSKQEIELRNRGLISNKKLLFSRTGDDIRGLLIPVLAHGFYDICCIRGWILLLIIFVIFMYVYCFKKVIKMSKYDRLSKQYINALLLEKYPELKDKLGESSNDEMSENVMI